MIHFNIQSSSNSFYWHSPIIIPLISSLFRPGISGRNVAPILSRLVALSKCLGTTERECIGFRTQAILEGHCKQQKDATEEGCFFFRKIDMVLTSPNYGRYVWIRWRFGSFHLALIPSNSPELRSHVAASPTKAMMTVHSPGASSILWSDGPAQAIEKRSSYCFLGGRGKTSLKLWNCPTLSNTCQLEWF